MRIVDSTHTYRSIKPINSNKEKADHNTPKKVGDEIVYQKRLSREDKQGMDYTHLKPKKYTVNRAEIERMKQETEQRMREGFMQMAKEIINDQSVGYKQALQKLIDSQEISPEKIEQARLDITEGGFWSVEKTTSRILKFAKALAGSDPGKAAQLKEGFLKGFAAAEQAWGGQLPDICYQTKEAVVNEFDSWEASAEN